MKHSETAPQQGANSSAFRARMIDQCHRIKRYRLQVWMREHRKLSNEQAAREWIARHAAEYAAAHPTEGVAIPGQAAP